MDNSIISIERNFKYEDREIYYVDNCDGRWNARCLFIGSPAQATDRRYEIVFGDNKKLSKVVDSLPDYKSFDEIVSLIKRSIEKVAVSGVLTQEASGVSTQEASPIETPTTEPSTEPSETASVEESTEASGVFIQDTTAPDERINYLVKFSNGKIIDVLGNLTHKSTSCIEAEAERDIPVISEYSLTYTVSCSSGVVRCVDVTFISDTSCILTLNNHREKVEIDWFDDNNLELWVQNLVIREESKGMKMDGFLAEKTRELAEPVKDFMGTLAIYEGEVEPEINRACEAAYDKALDAVREWLRVVSLLELINTNQLLTESELDVPGGRIVVYSESKVSTLKDVLDKPNNYEFCDDFSNYDKSHGEKADTPIGQVSVELLKYILRVEGNPVKLLYTHLGDLVHGIRNILSLPLHSDTSMVTDWDSIAEDSKDAVEGMLLTDEFLKEHGIQDVIGVHKYESLLFDISKFFESYTA